jgi:hypothetical protein
MISLIPDNFTTRVLVALPALLLTSRRVIGISIQLHSPLDEGAVTSVLLRPTTSGRKQGGGELGMRGGLGTSTIIQMTSSVWIPSMSLIMCYSMRRNVVLVGRGSSRCDCPSCAWCCAR